MFEVNITHKHYSEDIINLLCSGFEGGINYWACVVLEGGNHWYDIENPDWCVTVYDNETDDVLGKLNLAALQPGLKSMHEIAPRHYDNLLKDDCDAITGDVFIQCCLFNEIVYG
jgi:hypothetical protein